MKGKKYYAKILCKIHCHINTFPAGSTFDHLSSRLYELSMHIVEINNFSLLIYHKIFINSLLRKG